MGEEITMGPEFELDLFLEWKNRLKDELELDVALCMVGREGNEGECLDSLTSGEKVTEGCLVCRGGVWRSWTR